MSPLRNHHTTLRFAIIGVIVLSMLIPLAMVDGVTEERQQYFDATVRDIATAWGEAQTLAGPFLVIPEIHRHQVKQKNGELVWRERTVDRIYLPQDLKLKVVIEHQTRRRSIYEVPVYQARIEASGQFAALDPAEENLEHLERTPVTRRLDATRVVLGISHTQAISSVSPLKTGEESVSFRAGTGQSWLGSGVHAPLASLTPGKSIPFELNLDLKGTGQFSFTPVGDATAVQMASSWPHPSFSGRYLPDRYAIDPQGFTAEWRVHELARNLPGSWLADAAEISISEGSASVAMFQPLTGYRMVDRAIKYGLLFVALTFLAFVCFELTTGIRFHAVQYGVIGSALVLFYLALLSLSEHLDFTTSYIIATALLTGTISWYLWVMARRTSLCLWIACILVALYFTLFVLLRLEAYALLAGSAALFLGLFALMYTTRTLTEPAVEPVTA